MKNFAIIIINYNCSKDTIETLESVFALDNALFDVFLVDNDSKKEDRKILEEYLKNKSVKFIKAGKNLGFASGNNLAIKKAVALNYQYIFLLNPDTIITDKYFFNTIEAQINREKADIIGPLIKHYPEKNKIYFAGGFINKHTGIITIKGKGEIDKGKYADNINCDFITGCAIIIKKNVFEKIGYLPDDYFLYFEETDFCAKAKQNGFKIIFSPKTFIYHKVSASIKYLSNTYLYYMTRNYKIFANKFIKPYYRIFFYLYYLLIWCPGYLYLSIVTKNYNGWKYILKGMFGLKYE